MARSIRILVVVLLLAVLAGAWVPPAGAGSAAAGSLRVGDSVFWTGPGALEPIRDEYPPWSTIYDTLWGESYYWDYSIEVAEPAYRLRAAIDYPPLHEGRWYDISLIDPSGTYHYPEGYGWSQEVFVKEPAVGAWTIQVWTRSDPEGAAFRLRAKLEDKPHPPDRPRVLPPNLRVEPPFGLTFDFAEDWVGAPPAPIGSVPPSCSPDETTEDQVIKCLRIYVGAQNSGAGPLLLEFSPVEDAYGSAQVYQVLYKSDDTKEKRKAGHYYYHLSHAHYHFSGFATLELFRVTDRDEGTLQKAGVGNKQGFCLSETFMNTWNRFIQVSIRATPTDCGLVHPPDGATMGLSNGWTDVYSAGTPGNYVEFGDNPDGYYVIRAGVDQSKQILETDEADNLGYTYIKVVGDDMKILERGHGSDPWDPDKIVIREWWRAL